MTGHYTNEAASELLREVTGIEEIPENCDGLAACLNAVIAIQTSDTKSHFISNGDYVELQLTDSLVIKGRVTNVPQEISGYWIIKEFDGSICHCKRPLFVRRKAA